MRRQRENIPPISVALSVLKLLMLISDSDVESQNIAEKSVTFEVSKLDRSREENDVFANIPDISVTLDVSNPLKSILASRCVSMNM